MTADQLLLLILGIIAGIPIGVWARGVWQHDRDRRWP